MAAATREIPAPTWREYFDEYSRTLVATEATIEVTGRDVGDQIAAERLVLTGITYDDADDVLVVGLDAPGASPEEYEHLIYEPKQVLVATMDDGETTFDVTDGEDHQHLLHLRPAEPLPS